MGPAGPQGSAEEQGTVALVTGATGAIGKAIARGIAALPGYQVVLLCRDEEKAAGAAGEIRKATGNPRVRYELVDVSRRSSVENLARRWQGSAHVLINNAAITPRRREETPEGIELQFATNVLGYFWLTKTFSEHLAICAPSRVVNVASYWAGGLDLGDPEFKRRRYDNDQAYRQSKQADRMLSVAFARRLESLGISVNACHPGDVNSNLSNNLGFGGHETPDQGAATPVWLAIRNRADKATGGYFEQRSRVRCRFGEDLPAVEQLYELCESF